jgi:ribosome-associated protein
VSKSTPEASLAFAIELARLVVADKCQNVVLLDVRGLSPVTDYLVLATGTSGRQMRSTADESIQLGKDSGFAPLSSSGLDSETWICVDFVDVLLHLFNEDSRQYYDLESLWGDAKRVDFRV